MTMSDWVQVLCVCMALHVLLVLLWPDDGE